MMNTEKTILVAVVTGPAIVAMTGDSLAFSFTEKQMAQLRDGKSLKKHRAGAGSKGLHGWGEFAPTNRIRHLSSGNSLGSPQSILSSN